MITIDQLLESVNYRIEPKWVTKDKDGTICIFGCDKPETAPHADFWAREEPCVAIHHIKLSEFDGKDWTDCIYEVPRKTTGEIEKLTGVLSTANGKRKIVFPSDVSQEDIISKLHEVIDAVNELKAKGE